ncbi:hypothetical protein DVH24_030961 [Malus domestica]|uniref:Uncharacterized protein n=1 Tax=Malus domestica TaxID=3750 RepID=A0A498HAY9_MALDO|nr:hypothetical protein DVH24_030961 [Malus domestica]
MSHTEDSEVEVRFPDESRRNLGGAVIVPSIIPVRLSAEDRSKQRTSGAHAAKITFTNHCSYTVWPGTLTTNQKPQLSLTGFELASKASRSIDTPSSWSGRFWARTRCSTDAVGNFTCETADCGSGQVACNGAGGAPPATLVEITIAGIEGLDFYDVSLVDGFNLPMSVAPQGGTGKCQASTCDANVNAACPAELQVKSADGSVISCKSACLEFTDPKLCQPTEYSKMFKQQCPQAYSYALDDANSTFTCNGGPDYAITFCSYGKGKPIKLIVSLTVVCFIGVLGAIVFGLCRMRAKQKEYAMGGIFFQKSDVYSFGVLVLEIISSKKNTAFYIYDRQLGLLAYAWQLWKEGRELELVDEMLAADSYSAPEVMKCVHIGLLCVQDNPTDRPSMPDVIFMLNGSTNVIGGPQPKQPLFTIQNSVSHPQPQPSNNEATMTMINEGR